MDEQQFTIALPKSVDPNLQLPDPTLLQFYKDLDSRTIWMLGEVDDQVFDWIEEIIAWNREDKDIPVEDRKPIKCLIANYGGSLDNAKSLIEIIKLSKTPVYGIAIGVCASAASIIYLVCHKRFATKNVTFVFHRGACNNLEGSYSELNAFMENYKKDIDELATFYKKYTRFAPEKIDDHLDKGDWYVRLEEGLENGVIDEIVEDIDVLL